MAEPTRTKHREREVLDALARGQNGVPRPLHFAAHRVAGRHVDRRGDYLVHVRWWVGTTAGHRRIADLIVDGVKGAEFRHATFAPRAEIVEASFARFERADHDTRAAVVIPA